MIYHFDYNRNAPRVYCFAIKPAKKLVQEQLIRSFPDDGSTAWNPAK